MTIEPGRYRHYKGGTYRVIGVGRTVDSGRLVVVYVGEADGAMWVRPLDAFTEHVASPEPEVGVVPRFKRIGH